MMNRKSKIFAGVIVALLLSFSPVATEAARTQSSWLYDSAGYIFPAQTPVNVLISGTNRYLNFGTFSGTSGYGFRDNAGVMEFKDNGGSWAAFGTGSGGGTGTVSTSTNETSGYVPYWTTTSGTPARLGSDSGLQYSDTADRLTTIYASSTALSATTLCLTGDSCRTSWPSGASADWNKQTNYNVLSLTPTTTIPVWFKNQVFASSTAIFGGNVTANTFIATGTTASILPYASSTSLSSSGSSWFATDSGSTGVAIGTTSNMAPLSVLSAGSATGLLAQTFSYGGGGTNANNYNLDWHQVVRTGFVTWCNTQENNGTTYSNFFCFDQGNVGVGTTTPTATLTVTNQNTTPSFIVEDTSVDSSPFLIDTNGNVGIGTTTPGTKLTIDVGNGTPGIVNVLQLQTSNAAGGDMGPAVLFTGYASRPMARIVPIIDPTAFLGGNLWFQTYQNNATPTLNTGMMLDRFGFLGIGTTSPKALLDVWGSNSGTTLTTFQSNPNISITNADGTANTFSPLDFRTKNSAGTNVSTSMITGIHLDSTAASEDGAIAFHGMTAGTFAEWGRFVGGNLGIGTSTPIFRTELYGTGQLTAALTDAGSRNGILALNTDGTAAGNGGALVFGNLQSHAANSLGFAAIKGLLSNGLVNTIGDLAFSTRNATTDVALTERMRILSSGFVGVASSTPFGLFSIEQGTETYSGVIANSGSTTPTMVWLGVNGNGFIGINKWVPTVALDVNGAITLTGALTAGSGTSLGSNGVVTAGNRLQATTVVLAGNGSAGGPSFSNIASSNLGMYFPTNSTLGWSLAALQVMSLTGNGNLGIGSTTAYASLGITNNATTKVSLAIDALSGSTVNSLEVKLASSTVFTVGSAGNITSSSLVATSTISGPLILGSTGGSPTQGNATLVGGTITVITGAASTNSFVHLTRKTSGGTIGTAITYTLASGSFTINSDNPLDTSVFTWLITN